MIRKIVVYKNGNYIVSTTGITWEYENDSDWLTTIDLCDESTDYERLLEETARMMLSYPEFVEHANRIRNLVGGDT